MAVTQIMCDSVCCNLVGVLINDLLFQIAEAYSLKEDCILTQWPHLCVCSCIVTVDCNRVPTTREESFSHRLL